MGLRIETETVINWNLEESTVWIGTRMPKVRKIMQSLGVEIYRMQADYYCYKVPKSWLRVTMKGISIRPRKELTKEQKAQRAEASKERWQKVLDAKKKRA